MFSINRQQRVQARDLLQHCFSLPGNWTVKAFPVQEALVEEQVAWQDFADRFEERFQEWQDAIKAHDLKPEWAAHQYIQRPDSVERLAAEFESYERWQAALSKLDKTCRKLHQEILIVDPRWRS